MLVEIEDDPDIDDWARLVQLTWGADGLESLFVSRELVVQELTLWFGKRGWPPLTDSEKRRIRNFKSYCSIRRGGDQFFISYRTVYTRASAW